MKNNLVKNNLLSYCAGSALFALLAFPPSVAEAGIHLHGEIRMAPGGQVSLLYDSSGFPIWGYSACGRPPQACPSTSSGASTAAATFPPGIPGRIITAPSGLRASAADAAPRIRSMEWRTRLPVRIAVPTAPGPLTADFRPISAADDSIYFLILFCTFETKKLIVNQKKMFDNFSFSLIVFG